MFRAPKAFTESFGTEASWGPPVSMSTLYCQAKARPTPNSGRVCGTTLTRSSIAFANHKVFRGIRLGPFRSVGQSWHSLRTEAFDQVLSTHDCIKSYMGSLITADYMPIGFPPLHMHHLHIERGRFNHWLELHGDYSNGSDFGVGSMSSMGYYKHLPAGFCLPVSDDGSKEVITVDLTMNDVRTYLSPAHTWIFQLTVLLAGSNCKHARKLWLQSPASTVWMWDAFGRYAIPDTQSVSWWSGLMPYAGQVLTLWLHSHRIRVYNILLIEGTLSLRCAELGIRYVLGDAGVVANLSASLEAVSRRNRVICRTSLHVASSINVVGYTSTGVSDGGYDRSGALDCAPWTFDTGDRFTVVAAHHALSSSVVQNSTSVQSRVESNPFTAQHTDFFIFVRPQENNTLSSLVVADNFLVCQNDLRAHILLLLLPLCFAFRGFFRGR